MEADERPTKLRKLSHGDQADPTNHLIPEATASYSNAQPENSKVEHKIEREVSLVEQEPRPNDDNPISNEHITANPDTITDPPLSKKQLKKQRKRQEWEAGREFRKVKRKEKTKERKLRRKERQEREAEERKSKGQPQRNAIRHKQPVRLPVTFMIDCGFDDKMAEKERISLASQLTRAYSDNSRAPYQAHLTISSWGGQLKERFDTVLDKHHLNWKGVRFTEADFVAAAEEANEVMRSPKGGRMDGVFQKYAQKRKNKPSTQTPPPPSSPSSQIQNESVQVSTAADQQEQPSSNEPTGPDDTNDNDDDNATTSNSTTIPVPTPLPEPETIYLTSDSPDTLESLNPYSTYIIGGLVDKNRYKGICYETAQGRGVKTAKLPIGEYMEMQSRFVLATNHVVEIMIRWLECGDWGEAFMKVIPKRKGGKLKEDQRSNEVDEEGEEEKVTDDGGKVDEKDRASLDEHDSELDDDNEDDDGDENIDGE